MLGESRNWTAAFLFPPSLGAISFLFRHPELQCRSSASCLFLSVGFFLNQQDFADIFDSLSASPAEAPAARGKRRVTGTGWKTHPSDSNSPEIVWFPSEHPVDLDWNEAESSPSRKVWKSRTGETSRRRDGLAAQIPIVSTETLRL